MSKCCQMGWHSPVFLCFLWVRADTILSSKKLSFRHYLIVSAVTNLLVNLLGVWFFRNYARVNIGIKATYVLLLLLQMTNCICSHVRIRTWTVWLTWSHLWMPVYRNAEDMNYHSVCLHVLADSIRRYMHAPPLLSSSLVHFRLWYLASRHALILIDTCSFFCSAGLILASWFLSLG